MTDPQYQFKVGPVPDWFWDCYDAIIQGKPIDESVSIRQQPVYLRWRYRTVYQLMKQANVKLANENKAMSVYNWSEFH